MSVGDAVAIGFSAAGVLVLVVVLVMLRKVYTSVRRVEKQ